ncbi:sulfite exporter TauE/SafE family protein [Hyphomicrobium sp.]|uniref:sulfite exporter TauE/SafE family protein n=1 Tax=Hyphomicrobium sp. TaxID=82 RepID=UPI000FB3989B|nr:sulfite exporter TauE/SafE family protein [Hyphomicrobium sp.]MBN9247617.1 sulfite exporter TauE/SafE family protein [Hyphomicrobium sp.]RUP09538.1 MAG: sulfite exporter TauE/SafE family protein [Hyphomicrobium sp.]
MTLYLPIAEMSVSVIAFLALGATVGFLSGLFGVGGGFLLAPLLTFLGIPPGVAVATSTSHVAASSVSGAMTQYRRGNVDIKLASVMLAGGIAGSYVGVAFVKMLTARGLFELTVSLTYVIFLGVVGTIILIEGINSSRKTRTAGSASVRKPGQHGWMEHLPFKMRFPRSKLYISAVPPVVIGMFVGFISAIMGIGGGFVMIPAMIYLLRVPTVLVIGTSLFQIVFVSATATVLHAVENKSVDIVLATILILGGVFGAQFGTMAGEKIRGEHLRVLLGALILLVAARMAVDLAIKPGDLFSLASTPGAS